MMSSICRATRYSRAFALRASLRSHVRKYATNTAIDTNYTNDTTANIDTNDNIDSDMNEEMKFWDEQLSIKSLTSIPFAFDEEAAPGPAPPLAFKPYFAFKQNKLPFRSANPSTIVKLPQIRDNSKVNPLDVAQPGSVFERYLQDLSHLTLDQLTFKYPLHCPALTTTDAIHQLRDEFLFVWFNGVNDKNEVSNIVRHRWLYPNKPFDEQLTFQYQYFSRLAIETDRLAELEKTPYGMVVYAILLDYIPRRIFRGTSRAFAGDRKAEGLASKFLAMSWDYRIHGVYAM